MSVFAGRHHAPPSVPATAARSRPVTRPGQSALDTSPTMPIWRVFFVLALALGLSVIMDAPGIVHAGKGMPDGTFRTVTLDVGQSALRIGTTLHLTWPWEKLAAARGYQDQPSVPPLLAGGSGSPPPSSTSAGSPAVLAGKATGEVQHAAPRKPQPWRPPHYATRATPLRLLVTGDSLTGYLGPVLVNEASSAGPVVGFVSTHDGTGITRPDFVDWSLVAQQQVTADHPDAVVVMIGGNDFQNMTLGNRVFIAGTPAWRAEYARRVAVCMRIWAQGGTRRVYWLSMTPARDPSWAYDDSQINIALQQAAKQVRGARYLNILGPVTNKGKYTDFVNSASGPLLIREPDGVHLNLAGSTIVANEVLKVLKQEWHLGWRYPNGRPPHLGIEQHQG